MVETTLRDVLPHAMGNGHPAFFGWVNSPPSPAGVIASLAAAAMNPSVVTGDQAAVHLERAVVRWLAELVGFPHAPGAGLLTSGGSNATIVCLAGARSRALAAAGHDVRRDGLAGAPQLIAVRAGRGPRVRAPRPGAPWPRQRRDARGAAGGRPSRCDRAARVDSRGPSERRPAGAARRLGWHRQRRRDRPARCARRGRDRGGDLVPRRRRIRRVRRARPGDRGPLPGDGAGRLARPRSAQVARRSHRRRLRARAARRRPARGVQPDPAIPAPRPRPDRRNVRRTRARADETVPRAQDVGNDRRARARRHRRPGGARERTRPRAGDAGRARTRPGAGSRAPRPPSLPSGRIRKAARPTSWTSSTAHCRRRFRPEAARSSPGPSSTAARRCAHASCTPTRARSSSRRSWRKSSRPRAH